MSLAGVVEVVRPYSPRVEMAVEWGLATAVFVVLWIFLLPNARAPALDADSGTALSISVAATKGDLGPLINGLFPPLQTFVYAGMLKLGLTSFVGAIPVFCSLGLAMLLSAAAFRYTGTVLYAAIPVLVLLFTPVYWDQTSSLTFYAAYALMGYAGVMLSAAYLFKRGEDRRVLAGGALLLGGSLYAFTTALQFLPVPGVLLLLFWRKDRLYRTVGFYAATGLVAAPWFVWHILVGGTHFYYHPLNWIAGEHLAVINSEFWGYPHESFVDYVPSMLQVGFKGLLVAPLWLLVPFGLVEVGRRYGVRAALFVIVISAYFLLTIFAVRPAPFARYFYTIMPLCVFLASIGGYSLVSEMPRTLQRLIPAAVALGCLFVLVVAEPQPVSAVYRTHVQHLEESPSYEDMRLMSRVINDDRAVIGRDSRMQILLPANIIKTFFQISETDYVTYLSWPSETEVLQMLEKNNIGWILLYKDADRWERDYHVWLNEAYGMPPRHYLEIPRSASFQLEFDGRVFSLYKVVSVSARTNPSK